MYFRITNYRADSADLVDMDSLSVDQDEVIFSLNV